MNNQKMRKMKKIERCSELLEKATKFMNKDVELFWRVSSIFWGEMIQWLRSFIDEKEGQGVFRCCKRGPNCPEEEKQRWSRLEKMIKISELQKNVVPSEDEIKKSKRKRESWREWREPTDTLHTPPSRKEN